MLRKNKSPFMDAEYWNERYRQNNTPWDAQSPTKPIVNFIDNIQNKSARILFPGAGRAHEAIYAFENDFKNVHICDWSESALEHVKNTCPHFPSNQLLNKDFFKLEGSYDYIIEQTFFCAIDPNLRSAYAEQVYNLLNQGGILAGLLFIFQFNNDGPPYGGSISEYEELFSKKFKIEMLQESAESIKPRLGNEVFIIAKK